MMVAAEVPLARYAEEDRGDVTGGAGDGVHPEEEAEGGDGLLDRVGEGEHQGQGGQPAEPGQDADDESDPSSEQEKTERGPGQDLEQATYGGLDHSPSQK